MTKKIIDHVISILLIAFVVMLVMINEVFFTSELMPHNFLYIFISMFVFFTSIVVLGVTIYYYSLKQKNLLLLGFSAFSLMTSIWCLVQIDFITDLFRGVKFIYYVKNYTLFLLPLAITVVAYSFNKDLKMRIIYISSSVLFLVFELLSIISHLIDTEVLKIVYYIGFACIIIYFVILIVMIKILEEDNKKRFVPFFLKSMILATAGFAIEFINIFAGILGPIGMYLTITMLALYVSSIGTVVQEYVRKENYRTYLSEENARLSSSILLSQIKPHFLYNALNSISFLCKKDPKQADMAVIRFSRYLRQNMKCIESSELVDFSSEMEHIKNYLYLETIRFPKMDIIYELKYIDFKVPPLCIQPIVENSVKHGVSKNTEGGYVIIKSYVTVKHIVIEISDNGPGFDTKVDMKGTGLSNISRRLKMLMEAEIEFGSVIGTGTVVRVKIPREGVK